VCRMDDQYLGVFPSIQMYAFLVFRMCFFSRMHVRVNLQCMHACVCVRVCVYGCACAAVCACVAMFTCVVYVRKLTRTCEHAYIPGF